MQTRHGQPASICVYVAFSLVTIIRLAILVFFIQATIRQHQHRATVYLSTVALCQQVPISCYSENLERFITVCSNIAQNIAKKTSNYLYKELFFSPNFCNENSHKIQFNKIKGVKCMLNMDRSNQ